MPLDLAQTACRSLASGQGRVDDVIANERPRTFGERRRLFLEAAFEAFCAEPPSARAFHALKRMGIGQGLPMAAYSCVDALYHACFSSACVRFTRELRAVTPSPDAMPSAVATGYLGAAHAAFGSPIGSSIAALLLRDAEARPPLMARYVECTIGPATHDLARMIELAGKSRDIDLVADRGAIQEALITLHLQGALPRLVPDFARAAVPPVSAVLARATASVLAAISAADPLGLGTMPPTREIAPLAAGKAH